MGGLWALTQCPLQFLPEHPPSNLSLDSLSGRAGPWSPVPGTSPSQPTPREAGAVLRGGPPGPFVLDPQPRGVEREAGGQGWGATSGLLRGLTHLGDVFCISAPWEAYGMREQRGSS